MPYTATSLTLVWIAVLALPVLAAFGSASGPWQLLAVLTALLAPALLQRSHVALSVPVKSDRATLERPASPALDVGSS